MVHLGVQAYLQSLNYSAIVVQIKCSHLSTYYNVELLHKKNTQMLENNTLESANKDTPLATRKVHMYSGTVYLMP
jgi:hypothetical protein